MIILFGVRVCLFAIISVFYAHLRNIQRQKPDIRRRATKRRTSSRHTVALEKIQILNHCSSSTFFLCFLEGGMHDCGGYAHDWFFVHKPPTTPLVPGHISRRDDSPLSVPPPEPCVPTFSTIDKLHSSYLHTLPPAQQCSPPSFPSPFFAIAHTGYDEDGCVFYPTLAAPFFCVPPAPGCVRQKGNFIEQIFGLFRLEVSLSPAA